MNKPIFTPPNALSESERKGSREGTIGRFPSAELYEPEETCSVEKPNKKASEECTNAKPQKV